MRRLTLILSDLYLLEEPGRDVSPPPTYELPNLEWLLRFAEPPERIGDWRRWLIEQTPPGWQSLSIAARSSYGCLDVQDLNSTWFATPVALEARLDHVRLLDRGLLHLDEYERASVREEFARTFGPTYQLREGGARTFFLTGLPAKDVRTTDPARLIGSEIGTSLPAREAGDLRKLSAEIEMWLHGAAFNTARELARKRRVSALWIWGGDPMPAVQVESGLVASAYLGGDPMIESLSRFGEALEGSARAAPPRMEEVRAGGDVVVEFAALTGAPHESLQALDANWFAPVRAALASGALQWLDLVANDRRFRIRARQQWKFWRRRQHWLASLGS